MRNFIFTNLKSPTFLRFIYFQFTFALLCIFRSSQLYVMQHSFKSNGGKRIPGGTADSSLKRAGAGREY